MGADFSGYATKAGLKCSDGRVIMPDAFKHMDGVTVPLVWQHGHQSPTNILGHATLEHRSDGIYAYGYFNETSAGVGAKELVKHGDITQLSIYANQLIEKGRNVIHGAIREVSLVLAGANPGALIDQVNIAHSDGMVEELEDEAIIYTGLPLAHESTTDEPSIEINTSNEEKEAEMPNLSHADDEKTIGEIYEAMTQEQKDVLHFMVGAALEEATGEKTLSQSDIEEFLDSEDGLDFLNEKGYVEMTHNVFDQSENSSRGPVLSHSDIQGIVSDWQRMGSFKAAVEGYAIQHGIENIDILFPDAKMVGEIELDKRRTAWVSQVIGGVRKSPFARVKTAVADLTYDEARAKGYVKGDMKKEEFFSVSKRETTPQTIYKKQKLDRDDVIDITDLDIVAFMKGELRLMLDEEIARAILVGDGRDPGDPDKIKPDKIRPIAEDHSFYAVPVAVNIADSDSTYEEIVDACVRARRLYKGSGSPTFFTSETVLAELMLLKDGDGHRLYKTESELANAMRVGNIVEVEVFDEDPSLIGIVVNLSDYVVGSDRGGQVTMFDDFDIDYNQMKYLLEGRMSGALTKPNSALVIRNSGVGDVAVTPQAPAWDSSAYEVTIPTVTGVEYQDAAGTVRSGTVALAAGDILNIYAVATVGYFINPGARNRWSYLRPTGS